MASGPSRFGYFLSLAFILAVPFWLSWGKTPQAFSQEKIRKPAVSGQFYPDSPALLKRQILGYLENAQSSKIPGVRALIVPHAGYVYSGPVAAEAYKTIRDESFESVVILGFSHRTPLRGVFVDTAEAYETPLGNVPVNQDLAEKIRRYHPALQEKPRGEMAEHSIEVQVPFLQTVLRNLNIVPVYMGDQDAETVKILAEAVARAVAGRNILIVTSTDLSHYHPDGIARQKDMLLISQMEKSDIETIEKTCNQGPTEACGKGPVLVTLKVAQKLNWKKPVLLKYANSGDVSGIKTQVVGYVSLAIRSGSYEAPVLAGTPQGRGIVYAATAAPDGSALSGAEKKQMLRYVRDYLEAYFAKAPEEPRLLVTSPVLDENRGVFVTLKKRGQLRGCIGRITAAEPVRSNLKKMALAAALEDPRFPAVTAGELEDLEIHISILSEPKPVASHEAIRPGIDGIVVRHGFKSGVFLPEVATETGWDKKTFFLRCAVDKAGLRGEEISKAQVLTFQSDAFGENDF